MSKNNYKVLLTVNSKLGNIGAVLNMRKGYFRYLYVRKKALHVGRTSNLKSFFTKKAHDLIVKIQQITVIKIHKDSVASLLRKNITTASVIKEISKQVTGNLKIFYFIMSSISNFGTHSLQIKYMDKIIHTINVLILQQDEK